MFYIQGHKYTYITLGQAHKIYGVTFLSYLPSGISRTHSVSQAIPFLVFQEEMGFGFPTMLHISPLHLPLGTKQLEYGMRKNEMGIISMPLRPWFLYSDKWIFSASLTAARLPGGRSKRECIKKKKKTDSPPLSLNLKSLSSPQTRKIVLLSIHTLCGIPDLRWPLTSNQGILKEKEKKKRQENHCQISILVFFPSLHTSIYFLIFRLLLHQFSTGFSV